MSGKRTKYLKVPGKRMIPGDHVVRFYRDAKSNHPFMCISIYKLIHYGHMMTTHPSLKKDGRPRCEYIRFRINPNRNNKKMSYYSKTIVRIIDKKMICGQRLQLRKNWKISLRDLRRLKRIDKNKIKNVRIIETWLSIIHRYILDIQRLFTNKNIKSKWLEKNKKKFLLFWRNHCIYLFLRSSSISL